MESISYPDDSSNFAQRALKVESILIYFRNSLTQGDTQSHTSFDSFAMMMMMMMLDQFRSQAWACQGQARYRGQFISGGNTRIGKNDDEPPL